MLERHHCHAAPSPRIKARSVRHHARTLLRMRDTDKAGRGTWAAYVRHCREDILMVSKAELGRLLSVDRGTVHRWEIGANRTEDPEIVVKLAQLAKRPVDEALAAAGLRPGAPPPEPTRPPDPELDAIRESRLSPERKKQLIEWVLMRRARDEQARLDDLRHLMES